MEVKGYDKFRTRAYQNAIAAIDNLTMSVYELWENGRLSEIPGVGASLSGHIDEIFTVGKAKEFETLKENLPAGMFALLAVRGIGSKTAFKLAETFKLHDRETAIDMVKKAATEGKIREIPGFGIISEKDILEAILELKKHKSVKERLLLVRAEEIVDRILNYMKKLDCVERIDALGSYRRRSPTVGDLDFAVATENGKEVIEHFVKFPEIKEVLSEGDKKASVVLHNGVQVDIMVSKKSSYGALLQHFTGSKQHNILLRTFALERGMSLSEKGILVGKRLKEYEKEESFYKKLGLEYIPPELRHGQDEITASVKNELPNLVELKDIRGDVHTHTSFSDGVNSLEEMIEGALQLGYEYIGITDHSPSIQSRGKGTVLSTVSTTKKRIEQINYSQDAIRVLFGYEVSILADATLALPNDILEMLDFVIASIHTSFDQDRKTVTERVISAIKNPYVTIIGHPTSRLINQRSPVDIDWERTFAEAKNHNKILEINSQPDRLDLPDDLVREAIKEGIRLIINTDAHSVGSLNLMRYGIDVARRGWCEKRNIVNTLPLQQFLKELKTSG